MNRKIEVEIQNEIRTYPADIALKELVSDFQDGSSPQIVAAKVNNRIRELTYRLKDNCKVEFIDLSTEDGIRIYVRSLTFLFIRACREIIPDCRVSIEHSFAKGLYCEVHGSVNLTARLAKRIEEKMREIVEKDEPFERLKVSMEEAVELFKQMNFLDKIEILKYRPEKELHLYRCGWMVDYLYGYMVPSTGYLKQFELKFYLPGVIIRHPVKEEPGRIPEYIDNPKLFRVFRESEKWCRLIHVENVAELNSAIQNGRGGELIKLCEAHQENQIARIAEDISKKRDHIRLILIAGPSCSGKTTFAQRLRIQLMVNGLKPISISMDNYFVDREAVPLDEFGERDYESIDAIDLELFNDQMTRLIQGQEVELPYFNFQAGKREYIGKKIRIDQDQPIIVEGIHGLNEKLTAMIPKENKYKIYISALTQLNVDDHNRIHTTDTRLIRRIVRDHQFRGSSIEATLGMWPSVRRGEEKYIFPFQEEADVMLNSALIYELAVLKPYILPLLEEIDKNHPYYIEVNRLKKFMKYFVELKPDEIPCNSILREFIGGSCFQ